MDAYSWIAVKIKHLNFYDFLHHCVAAQIGNPVSEISLLPLVSNTFTTTAHISGLQQPHPTGGSQSWAYARPYE